MEPPDVSLTPSGASKLCVGSEHVAPVGGEVERNRTQRPSSQRQNRMAGGKRHGDDHEHESSVVEEPAARLAAKNRAHCRSGRTVSASWNVKVRLAARRRWWRQQRKPAWQRKATCRSGRSRPGTPRRRRGTRSRPRPKISRSGFAWSGPWRRGAVGAQA